MNFLYASSIIWLTSTAGHVTACEKKLQWSLKSYTTGSIIIYGAGTKWAASMEQSVVCEVKMVNILPFFVKSLSQITCRKQSTT